MNKPLQHYIRKLPQYVLLRILYILAPAIPDKLFLKVQFRLSMGYWMNLDNPKTFNEKLQWLKLYNRKAEYTQMVDKYAVKDYVSSIINPSYIIPTIGVWKKPDLIEWDALPDSFVLKTTHGGGGGGVVICRDKSKFDRNSTKVKLEESLKSDIYTICREWPYKNVPRRIIAEPLLINNELPHEGLRDYKFFCFNGRVQLFKIDFDRFIEHHANYYNRNGELLPFGEVAFPPVPTKNLEMPTHLTEMIEIAEKLALGHPFIRVDLYECNNKVYFGEMTFYPQSGIGQFTDNIWDEKLGEMLEINIRNKC